MDYRDFKIFIESLNIKEIDGFELIYVNDNDVEKIVKFDDVI